MVKRYFPSIATANFQVPSACLSCLGSDRSFRVFVATTQPKAVGTFAVSASAQHSPGCCMLRNAAQCKSNILQPEETSPKFGCEEITHRPLNGEQGQAKWRENQTKVSVVLTSSMDPRSGSQIRESRRW